MSSRNYDEKQLREAWSVHPFSGIALANVCIEHYEKMIRGWKETRRQALDFDSADDEDLYGYLKCKTKPCNFQSYVGKDKFLNAIKLDSDIPSLLRGWKYGDGGEEE
jgi:hypothetical protein